MKSLLLTLTLSSALIVPGGPSVIPPPLAITHLPSAAPAPVVLPVIPAAIVIGAGVGAVGWMGIQAINGILRIWERKVTNGPPPEVGFTLEEDYPE